MSTMTTVFRNSSVPYQSYFNTVPNRGNGKILHDFDEYSLDGSHGIESMTSILDGVSQTSSQTTLTTIDEDGKQGNDGDDIKPRLRRDLTALMSPHDREQLVTGQRTPRNTLRTRMGSFVSARTLQAQLQAVPLSCRTYEKLQDDENKKQSKALQDEQHHEKFIVWEVIPMDCERKFKRVLFKFSSTNGACFLLKYKYAVQFVQLLKKKTQKVSCGVFYQAFEFDGDRSSIFKADNVESWLETTITLMQPLEKDENGNDIIDSANVITKPSEMGLIKRIDRYLNRRRLKKLIRRQLAHTIGRVKRSRGRLLFAPFQFVWSVLTGKSRSSL
ncbi:hypothetical protein IV203_012154 [Nitzschia inconspicua]|uniref:Uncharacterized protein n=1 Tax=Nitzschia inconspicua TaxID=303405 RepID=A0A9K3PJ33_9STRA|nr:hypothetical protein IV203_012154 [Nitzschia inconspicua]